MNKGGKRVVVPSESSDGSTDDLILKDDDMATPPSGMLTTEPYDLKYVVEVPNKKLSKPCTFLNKFLILIVLLLLLSSIVFMGLYLHEHSINKLKRLDICTTAACVEAAAFMKSAMEESVNPCDDFYRYSCGGWLAKNPIPDGKSKWSVDSVLWDTNLNTMRAILNNMSLHEMPRHSVAVHNTLKFFQTCNNMSAINKLGAKPLLDLLNKIGGFTNKSSAKGNDKKNKLLTLIQNMHDYSSLYPYFVAGRSIDDKNSGRYILKFTQSGLGLELFRYKKNMTDSVIKAYIDFLAALGGKLMPTMKPGKIRLMAQETFKFEKRLSEIFVQPEQQITVEQTYHMSSIAKLKNMSSNVDYLKYVQHMFQNIPDIKVEENEPILIDTLDYFKKLDSVIDQTDLAVLQNYIMFSVASSYSDLLTEEYIHLAKNLSIERFGVYKELPRWKTCALQTDKGLGMALGSLFVQKTFAKNSNKEANELVKAVRGAFIDILPKLEWMDQGTAAAAKKKAESIIQKIGYPQFILNYVKLDKFYEGLVLKKNTYFENQVTLAKYHGLALLKRLRQPVDREVWYMTPPTINAYYNPSGNQIVFPAGILQPPFFKAGYPKALNFGSMGSVIGHEVTHGFDNNGRLYDADGNYQTNSWWSEESVKGFKKRTTCFIQQYSNFTVAGSKIKGDVTLGENIADNGGLKASFNAYSNWVKENGPELLLPGLGRSNDEVFFIAFGQSWCTGELNKRLKSLIETDVHSPFMERVKGSVQNSEDFSRIFKCPIGSPMNPKKKCSIW